MNCIASALCWLCCEIDSVCGFAAWSCVCALERREHRPVEALRALLDHALRLVVALHGHRALAAEERGQHGRAGEADAGRVDRLVAVDHVVHRRQRRLLAGADLQHPLALLEVVPLAAPVERDRLDRGGRRAEAPADAVVAVRRQLLRRRAELRPTSTGFATVGALMPAAFSVVHVGEDVVGLEHDRHAGDLAWPKLTVSHTDCGISRLEVLRDQRRQVREVALLGEAGDVRGLVVDDVRRGAADEARQQLVVHRVDVDRDDRAPGSRVASCSTSRRSSFIALTVVGCQT